MTGAARCSAKVGFLPRSVGCRVRMLERNPVVAALLDDGLARGYADAEIGGWLQERLQLIHASSLTALTDITPRPQVVYLDPMFPHKQKSALVKKEMRVFQSLVGPDLDADGLLAPARQLATKRVVVKRPDYAPPLAEVGDKHCDLDHLDCDDEGERHPAGGGQIGALAGQPCP